MMVLKRSLIASFFLRQFFVVAMLIIGGCSMASELNFSWEWPNDRLPDHKLAIKVDKVKPQSTGFLGLKKSPSFVTSLPDPMELTGTVISDSAGLTGKRINIVLPKLELGGVTEGDIVAIGVLDAGICICLEPIPGAESEAHIWLEQWLCPVNK